MHIGFLTPEYVIPPDRIDGGLANYLKKIAHALTDRGEEVSIIVLSTKCYLEKYSITFRVKLIFLSRDDVPMQISYSIIPIATVILLPEAAESMDVHKERPFDILQASSYMARYHCLKNGKIPLGMQILVYTPF